jgi:glycosyltransferase involved in cell wall biosynthesis
MICPRIEQTERVSRKEKRGLNAQTLENDLTQQGWCARIPSAWESLSANPPRAAFIAPPFDTVPSRDGNAIYDLIERIVTFIDIPCVVLSRWFETAPPISPISDRVLYYTLHRQSILDRLPHRIKKAALGTTAPSRLRYPRAAAQAAARLGISTIVVEDHPIFCEIIKHISPSPQVILHQHIDAPTFMTTYWWRRMQRSIDEVVFVAERTRNDVERKHGNLRCPSRVIYNGVDLAHYDPALWRQKGPALRQQNGIPADAPLLLFVGRLVPGKGPLEAIKTFQAASVANAHMIVVGGTAVREFAQEGYERSLREAGAHPNIHFAGVVSQQDLPAYYAAATLVVIPTIQSEGLPKVVTEALAMGRPVAATDRGGIWELLKKDQTGWLIPDARDVTGFSDLLRRLLTHPELIEAAEQQILAQDRPRMDEKRMVDAMTDVIRTSLARV